MTDTKTTSPNYFHELGQYLKSQFIAPIGHPTFWLYLIIAVIGAGGLGIWVAIYQRDVQDIVAALFTYFPAIAMASGFELILKDDQRKFVRSTAFATAVTLILIAVLVASLPRGSLSFALGIIGYIISLAFWWVANADNVVLHDTPAPSVASIGGKIDQPIRGDLGDLKD